MMSRPSSTSTCTSSRCSMVSRRSMVSRCSMVGRRCMMYRRCMVCCWAVEDWMWWTSVVGVAACVAGCMHHCWIGWLHLDGCDCLCLVELCCYFRVVSWSCRSFIVDIEVTVPTEFAIWGGEWDSSGSFGIEKFFKWDMDEADVIIATDRVMVPKLHYEDAGFAWWIIIEHKL